MTDELRRKDERSGAERCWIWRDSYHYAQVSFSKPDPKLHTSVEYVRVLSPKEWDARAFSMEGVDITQHLTRLHDKLEAQKREITRLHETIKLRDRENGALADGCLAKIGLKP